MSALTDDLERVKPLMKKAELKAIRARLKRARANGERSQWVARNALPSKTHNQRLSLATRSGWHLGGTASRIRPNETEPSRQAQAETLGSGNPLQRAVDGARVTLTREAINPQCRTVASGNPHGVFLSTETDRQWADMGIRPA